MSLGSIILCNIVYPLFHDLLLSRCKIRSSTRQHFKKCQPIIALTESPKSHQLKSPTSHQVWVRVWIILRHDSFLSVNLWTQIFYDRHSYSNSKGEKMERVRKSKISSNFKTQQGKHYVLRPGYKPLQFIASPPEICERQIKSSHL